jgi:hypothetical protein
LSFYVFRAASAAETGYNRYFKAMNTAPPSDAHRLPRSTKLLRNGLQPVVVRLTAVT